MQREKEYQEIIFSMLEIYSIEDYELFAMMNTCFKQYSTSILQSEMNTGLIKEKINTSQYVRVIFCINNKDKEIVIKLSDLKKIYSFVKIFFNDKNMTILVNKDGVNDSKNIIEKINSKIGIKGYMKMNLKFYQYPIKDYYLEEVISQSNGDFEKAFILKKKDNTFINNDSINSINNSRETMMVLQSNNDLYQNKNNTIISLSNNNNNIQNSNQNNQINSNNIINMNNYNQNNNVIMNSFSQNNNNLYINNCCLNNNININNNIQNNNIQNNNIQNNNNSNMNNYNQNNNNKIINYNLNNNKNNYYINRNNYNKNLKIRNRIYNLPNNNINYNNNNQNFQIMNNQNLNNNNNNYLNNNNINQNNFPNSNINQEGNNFNNQTNNFYQNDMSNYNMNLMNNTNNNNFNNIMNNANYNNMQGLSFSNINCGNVFNSVPAMNTNMNQISNNFNNINNINNNMMFTNIMNNNFSSNQNLNNLFSNNNKNNQNIQNNNASDFKLICNKQSDNPCLFPFVGLNNVGLTCYMNSTLQCLLHIPELNNYFVNTYPNQKENLKNINIKSETGGKLSQKYYELVKLISNNTALKLDSNYKTISPNVFHMTIGELNPQFRTIDANDSKDLLLFLFQSMHEELNYYGDQKLKVVPRCDQTIKENAFQFFMKVNNELNLSIFSYLFYGIFESETKCLNCNNCYYNFQYFQILSFPLYNYQSTKNKDFNIYQGFKDYVKKSIMKDDNQCFCQKCQKLTDSEVSSKIYYTPPYLIINLDYGKNKKYEPKKVNFGESLDLTGFTDDLCKRRTYELIAISSHIGRSGISGHYVAYCKNQSQDDQNWYIFNDSTISRVSFEKINDNSPYILIFKRVDN